MSDTDKSGPTGADATVKFTEREQQLLCWAMQSLKSGAPEIDYDKLTGFAGMSNPRSASNAWAKIKVKLTDGAANGVVPATPSKGGAKKKAVSDDAECTPTKTPRKRAAKKQDVDGEESPKKKGGRPKKPTNVKAEVKDEPKEEEEYFDSSASPIKATSEEDAEGEEEEEEV